MSTFGLSFVERSVFDLKECPVSEISLYIQR